MMQHLSNLSAAPWVTGTFIVLMALLLGNVGRLTRRQACRISVRARRSRES